MSHPTDGTRISHETYTAWMAEQETQGTITRKGGVLVDGTGRPVVLDARGVWRYVETGYDCADLAGMDWNGETRGLVAE